MTGSTIKRALQIVAAVLIVGSWGYHALTHGPGSAYQAQTGGQTTGERVIPGSPVGDREVAAYSGQGSGATRPFTVRGPWEAQFSGTAAFALMLRTAVERSATVAAG